MKKLFILKGPKPSNCCAHNFKNALTKNHNYEDLAETQSIAARHCEVLDEDFEWSRHCEGSDSDEATPRGPILHEIKRFRQKEAIHGLVLPKEENQKNLSASHHTGLPRYADATLAMTAAQPMNKAVNQRTTVALNSAETQSMRSCHPELVSGSQTRRLGFNPTSFNQRVTLNSFQGLKQCPAFSLVEMLMALLVASLLMAALAPVMTKRMDEAKINISGVGAAQYDKDALVSVFTGEEGEDETFNLPDGVNMVKVIMVGGGGAGGNSFFGQHEITTNQTWKVPDGVKKLRFFMVGGGGGGASGGLGTGTAKIPAGGDGNTYKDFLTAGEHTFTIPSTATKVPELDSACAASGATAWTGVTDGKEYVPGKVAVSVTACGGGGGGGGSRPGSYSTYYGGGGGSGGYIENAQLTGSLPSKIYVKVGGGGGGGATEDKTGQNGGYAAGGGGGIRNSNGGSSVAVNQISGGTGGSGGHKQSANNGATGSGTTLSAGGNGGYAVANGYKGGNGGAGTVWAGGGGGGGVWNGQCYEGGSGGGGAPTSITTTLGASDNILFQIGGGGGGGGGISCNGSCAGGGGGGGGGYGAGGGGGGSGSVSVGSSGNGYSFLASFLYVNNNASGMSGITPNSGKTSNGGGGGGGYGGKSGDEAGSFSGGKIGKDKTVWKNENYCDGGDGGKATTGTSGKPGALRLYYTYPELKCDFSLPANGSGGGGAGQITVGEIDVTPGETLTFEIGSGGGAQTAAGKNGNQGNSTRIKRGSTVIAEALGGLPGQYSSSETVTSAGGAKRNFAVVGNNWLNKSYDTKAGNNGYLATAASNKGYGGTGGASMNMQGTVLQGGAGGNSAKNGVSPTTTNYGAGGGGGSGSPVIGDTTFGIGAAGAGGFIYFEYGGTNGGGGTSGEIVTKLITNLKSNTTIGINIGEGGDNATGDGNGKSTTITYDTGTSKSLTARGGIKGNDGGAGIGEHAAEKVLPDTYANKSDPLTKGQEATELYGGIGGYIQDLWENDDNTWATYVKASDGKMAGPILGGCGGNLTTLMAGIVCNDAANTPHGKNGTFGGGGGGGAVINETGGLGGKGGRGLVIIKYKAVGL